MHDALTGHTTVSIGRRYGDGVPLDLLAEAVAKSATRALICRTCMSQRLEGCSSLACVTASSTLGLLALMRAS